MNMKEPKRIVKRSPEIVGAILVLVILLLWALGKSEMTTVMGLCGIVIVTALAKYVGDSSGNTD